VYTWLYNNMESVLMMIIFHGWSNTLGLFMVNAFNNPMAVLLTVALNWMLAIILVRRYGKENLSKKQELPYENKALDGRVIIC
jgi:hypothetical protein